MKTKSCRLTAAFMILALFAACGQENKSAPVAETSAGDTAIATQMPIRTPAPDGARVYFIAPQNGDVVAETFSVEFGVQGMSVVRAGEDAPASGHHHLLIDTDLPNPELPIPADANHVHFGDASTSTERTLPPGEHALQLLFADHLHIPHDPPVYSERITITVQ